MKSRYAKESILESQKNGHQSSKTDEMRFRLYEANACSQHGQFLQSPIKIRNPSNRA